MKKHFLYAFFLFIALPVLSVACSSDTDDDNPHTNPPTPTNPTIGNLRDGITRISDDSLAFVLFAPNKSTVHLIGDFNNWSASDSYKMQQDGDRFWIKIGGLEKDKEYICQYLIDNTLKVADPYASKVSDPNDKYIDSQIYPNLLDYPNGKADDIAMVVSTTGDGYSWNVKNFEVTNPESLNIYEILIRDFTEKRSIKGVQEKLDYLEALGVNAIELMPFNEFEGNDSWGYNPSFYFAPDKAYGTSTDYKGFIDECHKRGIAVIMDMVLNHSYGQNPMVRMYMDASYKVTADNPWFNRESPNTAYSWGYDFNHESDYTKQFVDSVCSYWMSEYKIDGFRFDFTKGFTNTSGDGWAKDDSRIAILKRMANEIWKRKSDALVIFEHLTDNSEEIVLADHGIYLWGNMNGNYNEATMGWGEETGDYGYKGDVEWTSYQKRGWANPTLIAYMESHDEERLMYKNIQWGATIPGYDIKDIPTGLQRVGAAAVIYMSFPGPKMVWQFGEMGYDYKLGSSMEDGRLDKKPIRWDYLDDEDRKALHDVFAEMMKLRRSNAIFSTTDYVVDAQKNFKQVLLKSSNGYICAVANLGKTAETKAIDFGKAATWKDNFSSEQIVTTSAIYNITLQPGEFRLYLSK